MQCHEFQEVMSRFIDGKVDGATRREVGLHLAGCEECMRLINEDSFWDDAVVSLLDREAPAGLRADILGDLAADNPVPGKSELSGLGWKKQMKIIGWAATRQSSPWQLWATAVIVAVILLAVHLFLRFFG